MSSYIEEQLGKININSATVNIRISDFEGNKTNFLGVNNLDTVKEVIEFFEARKKVLEKLEANSPVEVVDDSFMVCPECLQAIVNDDYSSLDYYYEPDEADKRMLEIKTGMNEVDGYICLGDSEKDEKFSMNACECCGNRLYGARYHMVIMKN